MPRGIICDKGFKILGTPLAFKGANNPGLFFYADLDMPIPRGTKRAIGTSVLMNALSARQRKVDAIAVSYDRMFKLGSMELKLLPSGMGPGAAMLQIKFKNKSILYTSGLRTTKALSGDQLYPVPSDILLVDYNVQQEKAPAPKTAKAQLDQWWKAHQPSTGAAAILCGNKSSLFDALTVIGEWNVPMVAHRTVYNLLRDTGMANPDRIHISRMGSRWPSQGVVLMMASTFVIGKYREETAIPHCYCGPKHLAPPHIDVIPFGESDHLGALIKFAKQCNVTTVAISPTGSDSTADGFRKAGFQVYFSKKPEQLKLPL